MINGIIVVKAVLVRVIFIIHALVCLFQAHTERQHDLKTFMLFLPLIFLLVETYFTLSYKEDGEWKWFCPSVFLYLCSVIPATWCIELDLLEERVNHKNKTATNSSNITGHEYEHYEEVAEHEEEQFLVLEQLIIPISFSPEGWAKVLEQLLLLILIIGRWLLPKGKITRDQLSQLLLIYIGTAADILELFEAFKEDIVKTHQVLTMSILACWSLSVLQFSLVVTSTRKRGKPRPKWHERNCSCFCCETELWAITSTVLMQDLPFLILRLMLIIKFKVLSYMNIFFTSKNTLVVLLQVYRAFTLCYERKRVHINKNGEITHVRHVSTSANLCEHSRDYSWKSFSFKTGSTVTEVVDIENIQPIIKKRTDILRTPDWDESDYIMDISESQSFITKYQGRKLAPSISFELDHGNSVFKNTHNQRPTYLADEENL